MQNDTVEFTPKMQNSFTFENQVKQMHHINKL